MKKMFGRVTFFLLLTGLTFFVPSTFAQQSTAAGSSSKETPVTEVKKPTDANASETTAQAQPAGKSDEATAEGQQMDIEDFVAGTVASVDAGEKKITVNSEEGGEVIIFVNDATEIYLWDDQVKLGDLKANDEVEIGYVTDQNKKNMATWVDIYREDAKSKGQTAAQGQ